MNQRGRNSNSPAVRAAAVREATMTCCQRPPRVEYSSRRRGAMLPLVAILLPVLLVVGSLVINIAYMELTRTELQVASDAATRAAGEFEFRPR